MWSLGCILGEVLLGKFDINLSESIMVRTGLGADSSSYTCNFPGPTYAFTLTYKHTQTHEERSTTR